MGTGKENAGCAILGLAYAIMIILSLIIHVWTIVIAYAVSGLVSAIISLIAPVCAQMYWFVIVWKMSGTVLNEYCLAILAVLVCWCVMGIGAKVMDS